LLQRGIATGEIRDDIDVPVYSHVLATVFTAMFTAPDQALFDDFSTNANEVVQTFIDLLKYGIAVEQLEMPSSIQGDSQ